ncbi:uncharacterized protein BDW43DRAFT_278944, partial [Aspergillus alliaceus]|uniref:uncharacterized protein n=1 Tax=Petromyces alliaceus TaxID=209559 RepID=UPI0012A67C9B
MNTGKYYLMRYLVNGGWLAACTLSRMEVPSTSMCVYNYTYIVCTIHTINNLHL